MKVHKSKYKLSRISVLVEFGKDLVNKLVGENLDLSGRVLLLDKLDHLGSLAFLELEDIHEDICGFGLLLLSEVVFGDVFLHKDLLWCFHHFVFTGVWCEHVAIDWLG